MKRGLLSAAVGGLMSLSMGVAIAQEVKPGTVPESKSETVPQAMPAGSYSGWSEAQKQEAATFLGAHCQQQAQCGTHIVAAQTGSTRAAYEAAACIAACFAANLPADYPDLDEIRKVALTNAEQARKLGSAYEPRFVPTARSAPVSAPPSAPPSK